MSSLTRQIFAEMQSKGSVTVGASKPKRKPAQYAFSDSPAPELDFLNFGSRLMSLSELATSSGIGQKQLRQMIRSGKLRPLRVPGGRRVKYSPQELAKILREYNEKASWQ